MDTGRSNITASSISQILFLMGVFLKQFYLGTSGGFQIGDACFMVSFVILLVCVMRFRVPRDGADRLLFVFVTLVCLINGIYIIIYGMGYPGDFRFHLSILYYGYNFFIVMCFRMLGQDEDFLLKLRRVCQAALLLQLAFAIFGLGRFTFNRYMGTFNDPNQCGFYIFALFLMIFLISKSRGDGHPILWYVISLYLIVKTVSTGMMLGMAVFLIVFLYLKLKVRNRRSAFLFLFVSGAAVVAAVLVLLGFIRLPGFITNSTMTQRIIDKIVNFGFGSGSSSLAGIRNLFEDRCWDRVLNYPVKMLYGAGEGYYGRFPSGIYTENEIHSSILGPLFCYGIIPCLILLAWIAKQMKGIKSDLWAAYIALAVESMTLVNNRQPLFWMLIVFAGCSMAKKYSMEEVPVPAAVPASQIRVKNTGPGPEVRDNISTGGEHGMKRVITYGTFDLLHYGHINLLKRAKALGDYLIVVVSTDEFNWNQKHKKCYFSYEKRKALVEAVRYVDLVIPEKSWEQKRSDMHEYHIDTFVMGDDWKGKFDYLKEEGVEVVYLPRTPEISSSQIKKDLYDANAVDKDNKPSHSEETNHALNDLESLLKKKK